MKYDKINMAHCSIWVNCILSLPIFYQHGHNLRSHKKLKSSPMFDINILFYRVSIKHSKMLLTLIKGPLVSEIDFG